MAHHWFYGVGAQEKEKQKEEVGGILLTVPLTVQLYFVFQVKQLFRSGDADHDGKLTVEERRQVLDQAGVKTTQ